MIELAGAIAMFKPTLEQFVRGTPDAVLLVRIRRRTIRRKICAG
jgi:hypothetical protein